VHAQVLHLRDGGTRTLAFSYSLHFEHRILLLNILIVGYAPPQGAVAACSYATTVSQDEEWTLDVLERPRKSRKAATSDRQLKNNGGGAGVFVCVLVFVCVRMCACECVCVCVFVCRERDRETERQIK
jgi:hypothetical protein